jgi:hypothetical protein
MSVRIRVAGLGIFVIIAAAGAQSDPYSSKEGNYRAMFPSTPKTAKQNLPGPAGVKVTAHSATVKDRNGAVYGVNYTEFPNATEAMLDAAVDAMIKSAKMKPSSREKIDLDGHPGRDVKFEVDPPRGTKEKGLGQAKCFLVGKRIYQVLVIGPESKVSTDEIKAFVDSFALLKAVPRAVGGEDPAAPPTTVTIGPVVDRTEPAKPVDPDGDCKITPSRTGGTIDVPAKVHDLSSPYKLYNAPRLMRDVLGDFTAEVRVLRIDHEAQALREGIAYRGAGLLFWQDTDHYVRMERAAIMRDGNRQTFLFFAKTENGQEVGQGGNALPEGPVTFKLERKGGQLLASYNDGGRWLDVKPMDISSWPAKGQIGVAAINATAKPVTAQFEAYKLRAAEVAAPSAKGVKLGR